MEAINWDHGVPPGKYPSKPLRTYTMHVSQSWVEYGYDKQRYKERKTDWKTSTYAGPNPMGYNAGSICIPLVLGVMNVCSKGGILCRKYSWLENQQQQLVVRPVGAWGKQGGGGTRWGRGGLGLARSGTGGGFHHQILTSCILLGSPTWGCSSFCLQDSQWSLEESHCRTCAFPWRKGRIYPSLEENMLAAAGPIGSSGSHFFTTVPRGLRQLRL